MKKLLLVLLILAGASNVRAGGNDNINLPGFLGEISATAGRNKLKFNLTTWMTMTTATPRFYNGAEFPTFLQLYVQPGMFYQANNWLNLGLGYSYERNNPFVETNTNEHRIWEQALFQFQANKVRISNRFRFEQRFLNDVFERGSHFGTRVRYQLDLAWPLDGESLDNTRYYLSMYDEIYLATTGPKFSFFDQNWAYGGLGMNCGGSKFEVGPMWQALTYNPQQDIRHLFLMRLAWMPGFGAKEAKPEN